MAHPSARSTLIVTSGVDGHSAGEVPSRKSAQGRNLVSSWREALAWSNIYKRDDPDCHPGSVERQGRRVVGACQQRTIPYLSTSRFSWAASKFRLEVSQGLRINYYVRSGSKADLAVGSAHRIAVRSAAEAAMGASTMLARLSAQSMRRGGQGEAGPTIAADTVATPKISTGT